MGLTSWRVKGCVLLIICVVCHQLNHVLNVEKRNGYTPFLLTYIQHTQFASDTHIYNDVIRTKVQKTNTYTITHKSKSSSTEGSQYFVDDGDGVCEACLTRHGRGSAVRRHRRHRCLGEVKVGLGERGRGQREGRGQ